MEDKIIDYDHVWPGGIVLKDHSIDFYNKFAFDAAKAETEDIKKIILDLRYKALQMLLNDKQCHKKEEEL